MIDYETATVEELLGIAKDETACLVDNEEFTVSDLFKACNWRRISGSTKSLLGRRFYSESLSMDHISRKNRDSQSLQCYEYHSQGNCSVRQHTLAELLSEAKNAVDGLADGCKFKVEDLFKEYEWRRIKISTRLSLGRQFKEYARDDARLQIEPGPLGSVQKYRKQAAGNA